MNDHETKGLERLRRAVVDVHAQEKPEMYWFITQLDGGSAWVSNGLDRGFDPNAVYGLREELETVTAQRDDLLAACRDMVATIDDGLTMGQKASFQSALAAIEAARTAIANASPASDTL